MGPPPCIVWLRQDLRLSDNPALIAAAETRRPLVLVYILDDEGAGPWRVGSAGRWWLHRSLVRETGATAIYWNRCYEPFAIARDTQLKQTLASIGVAVESSNGALLFEPWTVKTKAGEPFKVFTPYWRACLQLAWRAPHPAPLRLNGFGPDLASDTLSSWKLSPAKPNWAKGFEPHWTPGEAGALKALYQFTDARLKGYADGRDQLGLQATSRLSPHLHFGELSPAQVRTSIEYAAARRPPLQRCADKFLTELGWREFSANLLFHWPTLPTHNWRKPFDAFPWRDDASAFCAWTQGRTGYPIVDAAMRELWTTGYMHNRARMIAASFLIKHLLIDGAVKRGFGTRCSTPTSRTTPRLGNGSQGPAQTLRPISAFSIR